MPGTYRDFYACHFVSPNASDRIEIGDYEANASGAGSRPWCSIRAFCSTGCMRRAKRQALPILGRNVTNAGKTPAGVAGIENQPRETIYRDLLHCRRRHQFAAGAR